MRLQGLLRSVCKFSSLRLVGGHLLLLHLVVDDVAASIFHFGEVTIPALKRVLAEEGVCVRL